jgi:hypothetical protein
VSVVRIVGSPIIKKYLVITMKVGVSVLPDQEAVSKVQTHIDHAEFVLCTKE